ncbi:hypothetical protein C8R44DRAFT_726892 [Mycena epipterygia]|nr:hypothetical protein C8R44DRAFT_726892 [Mycena epipterygia]
MSPRKSRSRVSGDSKKRAPPKRKSAEEKTASHRKASAEYYASAKERLEKRARDSPKPPTEPCTPNVAEVRAVAVGGALEDCESQFSFHFPDYAFQDPRAFSFRGEDEGCEKRSHIDHVSEVEAAVSSVNAVLEQRRQSSHGGDVVLDAILEKPREVASMPELDTFGLNRCVGRASAKADPDRLPPGITPLSEKQVLDEQAGALVFTWPQAAQIFVADLNAAPLRPPTHGERLQWLRCKPVVGRQCVTYLQERTLKTWRMDVWSETRVQREAMDYPSTTMTNEELKPPANEGNQREAEARGRRQRLVIVLLEFVLDVEIPSLGDAKRYWKYAPGVCVCLARSTENYLQEAGKEPDFGFGDGGLDISGTWQAIAPSSIRRPWPDFRVLDLPALADGYNGLQPPVLPAVPMKNKRRPQSPTQSPASSELSMLPDDDAPLTHAVQAAAAQAVQAAAQCVAEAETELDVFLKQIAATGNTRRTATNRRQALELAVTRARASLAEVRARATVPQVHQGAPSTATAVVGGDAIRSRTVTPVVGGDAILSGTATPVEGGDTTLSGTATSVVSGDATLSGTATPVVGGDMTLSGTATSVVASDTILSDTAIPVVGGDAPVVGGDATPPVEAPKRSVTNDHPESAEVTTLPGPRPSPFSAEEREEQRKARLLRPSREERHAIRDAELAEGLREKLARQARRDHDVATGQAASAAVVDPDADYWTAAGANDDLATHVDPDPEYWTAADANEGLATEQAIVDLDADYLTAAGAPVAPQGLGLKGPYSNVYEAYSAPQFGRPGAGAPQPGTFFPPAGTVAPQGLGLKRPYPNVYEAYGTQPATGTILHTQAGTIAPQVLGLKGPYSNVYAAYGTQPATSTIVHAQAGTVAQGLGLKGLYSNVYEAYGAPQFGRPGAGAPQPGTIFGAEAARDGMEVDDTRLDDMRVDSMGPAGTLHGIGSLNILTPGYQEQRAHAHAQRDWQAVLKSQKDQVAADSVVAAGERRRIAENPLTNTATSDTTVLEGGEDHAPTSQVAADSVVAPDNAVLEGGEDHAPTPPTSQVAADSVVAADTTVLEGGEDHAPTSQVAADSVVAPDNAVLEGGEDHAPTPSMSQGAADSVVAPDNVVKLETSGLLSFEAGQDQDTFAEPQDTSVEPSVPKGQSSSKSQAGTSVERKDRHKGQSSSKSRAGADTSGTRRPRKRKREEADESEGVAPRTRIEGRGNRVISRAAGTRPPANRNKKGDMIAQWESKSKTEKDAMRLEASQYIATCFANEQRTGKVGLGKSSIVPYIRDIQELCPEAACISFKIFLMVHRTSGPGNYVCGFHQGHHTANQILADRDPKSKWKITGQPGPYALYATKKDNPNVNTEPEAMANFSCGCDSKEIAVDFYIWKLQRKITRTVGGEPVRGPDYNLIRNPESVRVVTQGRVSGLGSYRIEPRLRAWLVEDERKNGIMFENIFRGALSREEHEWILLNAQAAVLEAKLLEAGIAAGNLEPDSVCMVMCMSPEQLSQARRLFNEYLKMSSFEDGGTMSPAVAATAYISPEDVEAESMLEPPHKFVKKEAISVAQELLDVEEMRRGYIESILKPPYKFVKKEAGLKDDATEKTNIFFAEELLIHRPDIEKVVVWLPEARRRMESDFQGRVADLERQLILAKLDMRLAADMIRENASIVHTRKKLPRELWVEVFAWTTISSSRKKCFRRALVLSHVCRAWRFVIIDHARFWTDFDVSPSRLARVAVLMDAEPELLAGLKARFKRSRERSIDVVLSADGHLARGILELLVETAGRWGSLQLRSPELISSPRELLAGWERERHAFVEGLEPLKGRLLALRELTIEGHQMRGRWGVVRGDSLWQGDLVEERDKLRWFEDASQLRKVALVNVYCPEETVLVPWAQIEAYREAFTDRPGRLPVTHLQRMCNLVDLCLVGVWLPNAETTSLLEIPNLASFTTDLHGGHTVDMPNYDRLGVLVVPRLTSLALQGTEFAIQRQGENEKILRVDADVLRLLERRLSVEAPRGLVSLTLWLSTGVTDRFAITLLTAIPTLKFFAVMQEGLETEGVLTERFLTEYKTIILSLETLTIQGALGFPEDSNGMLISRKPWMGLFLEMLDFQFAHNLRIMDLFASSKSSSYCPFRSPEHSRLEEFMARRCGKNLVWHDQRAGSQCRRRDSGDSESDEER